MPSGSLVASVMDNELSSLHLPAEDKAKSIASFQVNLLMSKLRLQPQEMIICRTSSTDHCGPTLYSLGRMLYRPLKKATTLG